MSDQAITESDLRYAELEILCALLAGGWHGDIVRSMEPVYRLRDKTWEIMATLKDGRHFFFTTINEWDAFAEEYTPCV